ncbi:MAG: molybdopterin oxidoreductase family protein [Rhodospirillaceae bacterium]|jgi:anaerobic selenocysteine-containing dehydrogenase|nr:molybdopterin oxidoreductase family protein [Rhodospirillaceae bacterium]
MSDTSDHRNSVIASCPLDCPDSCAMLIDVKKGRIVRTRGNPDHPFTRGGLCIKMNNYGERVHSPDRVLYPLRRNGAKGSGQFERISWQDALSEIKRRWRALIDEYGPTAILPYSYLGAMGVLNGLFVGDAFFNRLGSSITERTFCGSGAATGYFMTLGESSGMDPESFVHAKYIVIWACNSISTNLHHWPFIAEAQRKGAKVVVIDPVRTRTAKKADWHLAIRPGTDAALALGMMHVIIDEGLADDDYVACYTTGFDALKARAAEYPPDKVAEITGLDANDIRQVAREFAGAQPAAIRMGIAIERCPGGGQAARALSSLPALVGAWRKPGGGILFTPEFAFPIKWDDLIRPDWVRPGTRIVNQWQLGAALTGDLEPPIRSLMVYNANPAVTTAEQDKVLAGLAREDLFTVVSEQFLTDTALYADIVLPATTQAEQFELMYSWGQFYLSVNEPAIAPLGEAVPNTELFRRLAATFDFDDAQFRTSDEDIARQAVDWDDPRVAGISFESLRETGFARLNLATPATYAPHAEGNFGTPSGKCEFYSSLAAEGNIVFASFRQGSEEFQPGEPLDPVPNFIPPTESLASAPELAERYPLNILSPKSHAFINSSFANLPRQMRHAGEQMLLIHPEDAAERNIRDGSAVRVHNQRGAFEAAAKVSDDTRPGVVVAPMGYWRTGSRSGNTVNAVNSARYADMGRAPTFSDNLVEVTLVA